MVYASTDEALAKIMGILAEAYTLPGADMDILDKLQDMITVHFQNKAAEIGNVAANMARSDQQQSAQGANPGGVPMRMAPGGASGGGMGGFGAMPNADELRRVLGGTGASV